MTTASEERDELQARHYLQCIREARFVTWTWILTAIYVSVMCANFGYIPPAERPDTPWLILGIPGWVVISVIAPWIVVIGVTWGFAVFVLKDDEPLHESELADDVI